MCRVWTVDASPTGERGDLAIDPGPAQPSPVFSTAHVHAPVPVPEPVPVPVPVLRSAPHLHRQEGAATADHQRPGLAPGSGPGSVSGPRLRPRGRVQLHGQASQCGQASPTLPYRTAHRNLSHLQCGTGCLSLFRFAPQAQRIPTVWVPREMNHASGIISNSLSLSSHSPAAPGVVLGCGPGLASCPGADLRGR